MIKLMQGDCLQRMAEIPDGSIDMVLCDLPYGTTECAWDSVIPLEKLWAHYTRITKPLGAVVLTCMFPFSAVLMLSAKSIFRYSLVWKKTRVSRFAQANCRPLCEHEDILVFSQGKCSENAKMRMKYNPQGVETLLVAKTSIYTAHSLRPGRKPKTRVTTKHNFPRSILEFSSENANYHPTQKPVALMEYLIRTYTNPGDTVLDNTMGSGTTGVACVNTRRSFIGIERDPTYFAIAEKRIWDAELATF